MPTLTEKLPLPDHALFGMLPAAPSRIVAPNGAPLMPTMKRGAEAEGRIAFMVPVAAPQPGLAPVVLADLENQADAAGVYWRVLIRGLACATFARAERDAQNAAEEKTARDAFYMWDNWADAQKVRDTHAQGKKDLGQAIQ